MTAHDTLRRLTEAFDFAAQAHTGQTRKGKAAEPYINHLADVAARVAKSPAATEAVVIAAILHDTVEDTETSLDTLRERFGPEVADLVAEVTDDKSLPKAERKRLQVVHAPDTSLGAKRIKLADKASNLSALADSPPHWWDLSRKREYLAWAREVGAGLRGVDPLLDMAFDEAAERAERSFGA